MMELSIPKEFEAVRAQALRVLSPIKAAGTNTWAEKDFDVRARPTDAGRKLPPYYLVYFLLVDLLGFPNSGRFEKVAWSVPIDFEGVAYLIEHRKFGLGVFSPERSDTEAQAAKIVSVIHSAVKVAKPYFRWVASQAIAESKLNVNNNSVRLFERFSFFLEHFRSTSKEAERRRDEKQVTTRTLSSAGTATSIVYPAFKLRRSASWFALATIDAFFSWTEHIFIHLAILQGRATTGETVAKLAVADWPEKFKAALDITDSITKSHFDELINMRRQLRNFMAHGAFGKAAEAFEFHSGAGAVPVTLDDRPGKPRFSITAQLAFDDAEAIAAIERFITHLWSDKRAPARIYLQDSDLPLVLPMASDGRYRMAMVSVTAMNEFVEYWSGSFDMAVNMDW